jgi:hypothetical protein
VERPSVNVDWRPSSSVAIVTHLVTRFTGESAAELATGNALPFAPVVAHAGCGGKREHCVYLGFGDLLSVALGRIRRESFSRSASLVNQPFSVDG